jgi:hypothetical protein
MGPNTISQRKIFKICDGIKNKVKREEYERKENNI